MSGKRFESQIDLRVAPTEDGHAVRLADLNGRADLNLTAAQLAALEDPPGSGLYPSVAPWRKVNVVDDTPLAEVTDLDLLEAVKRVDGAGSGLDADLLQGNSLSQVIQRAQQTGITTYGNNAGVHVDYLTLGTIAKDSAQPVYWLMTQIDSLNQAETKKGFAGRFYFHRGSVTAGNVSGMTDVLCTKAHTNIIMDYHPACSDYADAWPAVFSRVVNNTTEYWLGLIVQSDGGKCDIYFTGDIFGPDFNLTSGNWYLPAEQSAVTVEQQMFREYRTTVTGQWRWTSKKYGSPGKNVWMRQFTGAITTTEANKVEFTGLFNSTNIESLVNCGGTASVLTTPGDASSQVAVAVGSDITTMGVAMYLSIGGTLVLRTASQPIRTDMPYDVWAEVTTTDNLPPVSPV